MAIGLNDNIGDAEANQLIAANWRHGLGQGGFKRIEGGTGTDTYDEANNGGNTIVAILAVNGDVTFASGCTAVRGDAPSSGDVIPQGQLLLAPLNKVVLTSGVAYVFTDEPLS